MKQILITIAVVLCLALIIMALVVFGPLKQFLPLSSQRGVEAIHDYFTVNRGPTGGAGQTPDDTLPSGGTSTATSTGSKWLLPSSDGAQIEVAPFAPVGATSSPSVGTTPPTESFMIVGSQTEVSPYVISYSAYDQSFTLTLLKEPLGELRTQAEADFLKRLNITENQACRLKYLVNTPYWVNNFYTNKNLGFSFCPGATQL